MEPWVYYSALTLAFGFGFAIACAVFADKIGRRTPSASRNSQSDEIFPPLRLCCNRPMWLMFVGDAWDYWCEKCGNTSRI